MKIHWITGLLNKSRHLKESHTHFVICRVFFGRTGSQAWKAAFGHGRWHLWFSKTYEGNTSSNISRNMRMTRQECWGWALTLVWNRNTVCYNKLLLPSHTVPWGINAFNSSSVLQLWRASVIITVSRHEVLPSTITGPSIEVKQFSS